VMKCVMSQVMKGTASKAESSPQHREVKARPFLRWAGGKRRIVRHLLHCLPKHRVEDYWEPFLGAGALFFSLAPDRAHLSDSNSALIACFRQVRERPNLVYRYLTEHLAKTSEQYYYQVRTAYNRNRHKPSAAQAARFIYLNRTGFNGIFRVNRNGEYNVPYGHKDPPPAPSKEDLRVASNLLSNASFQDQSYDVVLAENAAKPGDLIYLDPPYPPLSLTSNFTHYTASRFSWRDHERLAALAHELKMRGCLVMISNSDTRHVRALYSDWNLHALPVTRWIAANGSRHKVRELVISSYPVGKEGS
jgi:DNA adenine methylase